MKITEIVIKEYGPVREFTLRPGQQCCIYGQNESGKTAIVEVLTYVLFKRSAAHLRYSKPKHVRITIEDRGRQFTLPAKKRSLTLPPLDIATLLYVHASQSSVFSDTTRDRFWDALKSALSGMESGITYAKLDEKVFVDVGLQPRKEDWKQEKQEQIDRERLRKDALGEYISKVAEIEHVRIERQRLEAERQKVDTDRIAIESWKKLMRYRELSGLYASYRSTVTDLQNYERYKSAYAARWQELEFMKRSQTRDRTTLQSLEQEIVELEKQKMDLQRKQDFIDAWDISPDMGASDRPVKPITRILPFAIMALAALVFVFSLFTPIPVPIAAAALLIGIGISGYLMHRMRTVRRRDTRNARILNKAEQVFPGVSTFPELVSMIEQAREEMIRVATLLADKKETKTQLSNQGSDIDVDPEIADIRDKTGLAELSDLTRKLEEKQVLEARRSELYGKIYGILGEKNDSAWERLIQNMKTSAPVDEPDVTREQELQETLAGLEKRIHDFDKQISVFTEIQRATYGIDDPRSAFIEYDRLVQTLEEYELEKRAALAARRVFADMSKAQDDYIHDVIAGDQSLSEYFRIITERYDAVRITDKDFVVEDVHGNAYPIDGLSSGTRDQLLLCFRFAALSKAYPSGIFLFLDDAFIFADWPRRRKMMDLMSAFVQRGNQVLYFTSDDHTRDLFRDHGTPVTVLD